MKIVHRVTIASSPHVSSELGRFGVAVPTSGLATFTIDESAQAWADVERWIADRGALDLVTTTFSRRELDDAEWLELVSSWHHGYPQPEGGFAYRHDTYARDGCCELCGICDAQIAPFRLKREPSWGRRGILQLNWVFDEFFVRPDVWKSVFQPFGISSRDVVGRDGSPLETVVQLVIDNDANVRVDGLEADVCGSCGRPRFAVPVRGFSPSPTVSSPPHMVRSQEWFGSGGKSFRLIFVSQELRDALMRPKVLGVTFRSCG